MFVKPLADGCLQAGPVWSYLACVSMCVWVENQGLHHWQVRCENRETEIGLVVPGTNKGPDKIRLIFWNSLKLGLLRFADSFETYLGGSSARRQHLRIRCCCCYWSWRWRRWEAAEPPPPDAAIGGSDSPAVRCWWAAAKGRSTEQMLENGTEEKQTVIRTLLNWLLVDEELGATLPDVIGKNLFTAWRIGTWGPYGCNIEAPWRNQHVYGVSLVCITLLDFRWLIIWMN